MVIESGVNPILQSMQIVPFLIILGLFAVIGAISSGNSSGTNPLVRVIWFILVGWWLGLIWFTLSIALMFTIIFFPIGAYTATKTWKVMTLSDSKGPKDAASDITVDVENKVKQETSVETSSEEDKDEKSEVRDKLQKLKDLKEDGLITEEEFDKKKKDVMDEI